MNKGDFEVIKPVAKGQYATISIVQNKIDGQMYAMKILNKKYAMDTKDQLLFMNERNLLVQGRRCEWLPRLFAAFQDSDNMYFIMEYCPGGDLWNLIDRTKNFHLPEDEAKFYLAELLLAIEEVHGLGYVHRDIKPHNVLIDARGHIKLCDFGSSAPMDTTGQVTSTLPIGTADYMAPEILQAQESDIRYGREVDWWSFGVVMYEILQGDPPFYGDPTSLTFGKILNHDEHLIFNSDIPMSPQAKDLILKLIVSPEARIAGGGIAAIKAHPFFFGVNWDEIHRSKAPQLPVIKSIYDTSNFAGALFGSDSSSEVDAGQDVGQDGTGVSHHEAPGTATSARNPRSSADLFIPGALGPVFEGRQLPFVGFTYQPGFVYAPKPKKSRKSSGKGGRKINRSTSPMIDITPRPTLLDKFPLPPTNIPDGETSSLARTTTTIFDANGMAGTTVEGPDPIIARTVQKLVQNTLDHDGKWRTMKEKELVKELGLVASQKQDLQARIKYLEGKLAEATAEGVPAIHVPVPVPLPVPAPVSREVAEDQAPPAEETSQKQELVAELRRQNATLLENVESVRAMLAEAQHENNSLQEILDMREEELNHLQEGVAALEEGLAATRSRDYVDKHADVVALEETLRMREDELASEQKINAKLREEVSQSMKNRQAEIRYIRKDAAALQKTLLGELSQMKADFDADKATGYDGSSSEMADDEEQPKRRRKNLPRISTERPDDYKVFSVQSSPTPRPKRMTSPLPIRSSSVNAHYRSASGIHLTPTQKEGVHDDMNTISPKVTPQSRDSETAEQKRDDLQLQIEELARQRDEMLLLVEDMRDRISGNGQEEARSNLATRDGPVVGLGLSSQDMGMLSPPTESIDTGMMVTAPTTPMREPQVAEMEANFGKGSGFDSLRPSTVASVVPVITPNTSKNMDALHQAYVEDLESMAKRNHAVEVQNSKLRREIDEMRAARDVLEEELMHYMDKRKSRKSIDGGEDSSRSSTPSSTAAIMKSIVSGERIAFKELQRQYRQAERRMAELEKENQKLRQERRAALSQ